MIDELGGLAASCSIKGFAKSWDRQDVDIKDILSDLDQTISDLIYLKLRLQVVANTNNEDLPKYESVLEKASNIIDEI